jgi:hypothetical protein
MESPNIAMIYGSFQNGDCVRDIQVVREKFPPILGITGYSVFEPVEGNDFDFDFFQAGEGNAKVLVLCTSSKLGFPPPNLMHFAYHLKAAAEKNPGCLKHLRHVVCGNGQEMYEDTYMNMPRYMDLLLEKCGSKRFYPRGEFGDEIDDKFSDPALWAEGMWNALTDTIVADGDGQEWKAIAWDALWANKPSPVHQNITEWDVPALEQAMQKAEVAPPEPSVFAKL